MFLPPLSIRARLSKLRPEQTFLIVQGALAALAITPFGIWRLINGHWLQGMVDLGIVAMMAGFAIYGTRYKHFRLVSVMFALSYTIGEVIVIALVGPEVLYWAFPAQVAVFFVLRSFDAFMIAILGLLTNTMLAYYLTASLFETLNFFVTDLLICIFAFIFSRRLTTDNQRLFKEATIDPLTGSGNRRSLDDNLARVIAAQEDRPVSLLLIDIDHFKAINDEFGHTTGDICLQRIAAHMDSLLDRTQRLFRYGGEEFVVLMEGAGEQASELAERLRSHIECTHVIREKMVTVSIGVAELCKKSAVSDALREADNALYLAKRTGRNKVCVATAIPVRVACA